MLHRPEFPAANLQRLFVGVRRHTIACVRDTGVWAGHRLKQDTVSCLTTGSTYLPSTSYTCYYLAGGVAQVDSWGPGQGSLWIDVRSTRSTELFKFSFCHLHTIVLKLKTINNQQYFNSYSKKKSKTMCMKGRLEICRCICQGREGEAKQTKRH